MHGKSVDQYITLNSCCHLREDTMGYSLCQKKLTEKLITELKGKI